MKTFLKYSFPFLFILLSFNSKASLITHDFDDLIPDTTFAHFSESELNSNFEYMFINNDTDAFTAHKCGDRERGNLTGDFSCGVAMGGGRFIEVFLAGMADYFSVVMGDYGGTNDRLYLSAYDIAGNLIGSTNGTARGYAGTTLSISSEGIHSVKFFGRDDLNGGHSVHWDNVNFNLTSIDKSLLPVSMDTPSENGSNGSPSQSVPEPSTLAIFALGIMGLASRRFKKQ